MSHEHGQTARINRLLERGAVGDDSVYGEVLDCAVERVYALTQRMMGRYPKLRRWEESDDVLQTVVIRLHQSLEEVRPDSVPQLMKLAATQIRRTLIDLVRHYFGPEGIGTRHHSDAIDSSHSAHQAVSQTQKGTAEEPETLEQWLIFHESVEQLAADERQIFELIWYGNMTQQQVSKLLDISPSTVKRRMRSVRLQLAAILETFVRID